jgi:hypothetical protein
MKFLNAQAFKTITGIFLALEKLIFSARFSKARFLHIAQKLSTFIKDFVTTRIGVY